MTTFDRREDAFENKFAHDEALRFRANARRNKLLGHWAAEKLGKSGAEAEEYARSVVRSDLQEAGDEDVLRKLRSDLADGGQAMDDRQLRTVMTDLMAEAVREIEAER